MNKIGFLFFWRLDQEKGFDLIISLIENIEKVDGDLPFSFYVFGDGAYKNKILELARKYSSLHYFGRKSLYEIQRHTANCDYCFMTSRFLETFWLTALTSYQRNLPVIGFSKWWLAQFMIPKYDISSQRWKTDVNKFQNLVQDILDKKIKRTKWDETFMQKIIKDYSKEQRKKNIKSLIGEDKKILMISDFSSKVWGIETYIHDASNLLREEWYEVKFYGTPIKNGTMIRFKKYLWIAYSLFNISEYFKLKKEIKSFQPDVIWCHSLLRWMGWFPLRGIRNNPAKKIMMYHDFWYFVPFPSKLYEEKDIKTPLNFKNYLISAQTKNPLKLIFITGKYMTLSLLKKQLKKQIDIHLVPSPYMEKIVQKSYKISLKKIQSLSHFLQS